MRRRFSTVTAATGVPLVLAAAAAAATPVELSSGVELYGGDYSVWEVANGQEDACALDPRPKGVAITDGQYLYSPATDDAFDGGHFVLLDGTPVAALTGSVEGSSVTAGPAYGAVKAWVTHSALAKGAVVRTLVRLKNVTSSPQTRTVSFHSNGGGDAAEDTQATSDGDALLERRDDWVVWSPGESDPDGDPSKTTALTGPGKVRSGITSIAFAPGDPAPGAGAETDCLAVDLEVHVPGGRTRYLLFFTWLDTSTLGGMTRGFDYTDMKRYLFKGLSAEQRAGTLNWKL